MLQFLLTLADESEHSKIEHIYTTYYDFMLKYASKKFRISGRTNYTYDAEDALQNTFIKIVRVIDKLNFSRGEKDVKCYAFAILTNEIHNILRKDKPVAELDENFGESNMYEFIDKIAVKEEYDNIIAAIESLDEIYSTTMYLAFCNEMSVSKIAELMGVSEKTIYARLQRGRDYVLQYLKERKTNE